MLDKLRIPENRQVCQHKWDVVRQAAPGRNRGSRPSWVNLSLSIYSTGMHDKMSDSAFPLDIPQSRC